MKSLHTNFSPTAFTGAGSNNDLGPGFEGDLLDLLSEPVPNKIIICKECGNMRHVDVGMLYIEALRLNPVLQFDRGRRFCVWHHGLGGLSGHFRAKNA